MVQPDKQNNVENPNVDKKDMNTKERPILVFVPGMSGTSAQLYAISMAKACIKNGYDCVVVNYRGCAGVPLTVSSFVWSFSVTDFPFFIDTAVLPRCRPRAPV